MESERSHHAKCNPRWQSYQENIPDKWNPSKATIMDMGSPVWEVPEWYPRESDGECWSLDTIELDEDIVENNIDREDDREDTGTVSNLTRTSQELEIDLDQEEKREKKCRISENSTRGSEFFSEKEYRHRLTELVEEYR